MSYYDDFHAIFSKYFWLMGHRKDNKLQHVPCKPFLYWELLLLSWASLVAEWWRIRLPIQQMQVQSLGQEDPLEEDNSNSFQYSCLGNPRQRSLVGYSLWGCKESNTTELLTLNLCIGGLKFTQENKLFQVSSFHCYQYFITSILLTMWIK